MGSTSPQQPFSRFHTPLPGTMPTPAPAPITPLPVPAPGQIAAPEVWRQQTMPQPAVSPSDSLFDPDQPSLSKLITPAKAKRQRLGRTVAVVLLLVLAVALYLTWYSPTPTTSPTGITQQNFSSGSTSSNSTTSNSAGTNSSSSGTIQVYIVGEVKRPGVYQLPADARVYQLLQAAGGPLPDANLVALNLAAQVKDGEEIYVIRTGETPPTYYGGVPGIGTGTNTGSSNGQLVNINTASSDEMRQQLHISSTTAQAIINYRQQNGAFTSVDQLQQVVSKSIYDKIKDQVTV